MSEFRDNKDEARFEWREQDDVAFADYRLRPGGVHAITHVETPPQLRGQGMAGRLMDAVVAHARAEGFKLEPHCTYAVAYFRRYPAAHDVLA